MTDAIDLLASLNDAQRSAAEHAGGPLIVLAGPGTGKTRVIVSRAAHLITERGASPDSVLALTFTNKAAEEMRERLSSAVGWGPAQRITAGTFNAFGATLLRRFSDLAGLPGEPQLIDSAQRRRLLRELAAEHGLFRDHEASGVPARLELAQRHIHALHCAGLTPVAAAKRLDDRIDALDRISEVTPEQQAERQIAERWRASVKLWTIQDAAMRARGLITYDDQIAWATKLLREQSLARDICRSDYQHVIVDEFQDLNLAQLEMLRLLAPPSPMSPPDVCVVGDDDQSIYGFRGADDRGFERFRETWSDGGRGESCPVREVRLTETYRSHQPVLDAANAIITRAHSRFAPEKRIERPEDAEHDGSAVVEGIDLDSYRQAGDAISAMIAEDRALHPERPWSAFAVIARTHGELDGIRAVLELDGVPLRIARPPTPADDAGVQDVEAWTALLLEPAALWAARRILRRPPFQVDAEVVTAWEQAFRSARSLAKAGDGETPEMLENVSFFRWLLAHAAGDSAHEKLAEQASEWFDRFMSLAASSTADVVMDEIVRTTGVAHRELLGGRARAQRVRALAGFVRFVRDRLGRAEPPGDLRAFRDYYNDLDENEQRYGERTDDAEPDEGGEAEDGVALLTAHAAKGLEFDTVFIPRVESQHGFPSLRDRGDSEPMPACLVDELAGELSARERLEDEERRLFYVACTRAERRLVLLGKKPNRRSKSVNYFFELLDEPGVLTERTAEGVFDQAERAGAVARRGDELDHELMALRNADGAAQRRARLESAERAARLAAARALDTIERTRNEDVFERANSEIDRAAAATAAIAAARRGEPLPAWVRDGSAADLYEQLRSVETGDGVSPAYAYRVPRPPLKVSFTMIDEYARCPRCFYFRRIEGVEESPGSAQLVGQVVHGALQQHVARVRRSEAEGEPRPLADELVALGDRLFFAACRERRAEADPEQLARIRAQLGMVSDELVPPEDDPELLEQFIEMPYEHGGRTHRVVAKLDRLDRLGASPGRVRIIDYKTGHATKKLLEPAATDVQLGLYAMLARHQLTERHGHEGELEGTAEYWVLSAGERGVIGLDALTEKEDKLREKIEKTIDGVMSGAFPRGRDDPRGGCWGLCVSCLGDE